MSTMSSSSSSSSPLSIPHLPLIHSWTNKEAHIVRKNGHVARCRIQELELHGGEVSIIVVFNEQGKSKRKAVCPLMIAATHVLWHAEKAVSSDEEDQNKEFIAPPDVTQPLPHLDCTNSYLLNDVQKRKLKWKLTQVNHMLDVINRFQ